MLENNHTIFTYKNLLKAYFDCRKTKRHTLNALRFETDLENRLFSLQKQLITKNYSPGKSIRFVVLHPKPREIFAADFVDRVVHHIIINEIQNIWEHHIFITDSYACRPEKGHHFAAWRVSKFCQNNRFFGQFDIDGFFSSINKTVLYQIIKNTINCQRKPNWWKEEILWLAHLIIFSDPTQNYYYKGDPELKKLVPANRSLFGSKNLTGLPIGNLTSQFFANVYLDRLDHFVTQELNCPDYGRYVDDFLIFSKSKENIISWRNQIKIFLEEKLHLRLHPRKQNIQPIRHGIPFAGYFIKPQVTTVRRNVVKNVKNKIWHFNRQVCEPEKIIASLNSYYGHFIKASSFNLRRHLYQKHLCSSLQQKFAPADKNYFYLKIKKTKRNTKKPGRPDI